jgi:hypothetical protein
MNDGKVQSNPSEAFHPYVVTAVYVSTLAFALGVFLGRGDVVLLALSVLLVAIAAATRLACETLQECLPLMVRAAVLLPPIGVVVIGFLFLLGGIVIDRSSLMIVGIALAAAGAWLVHYCTAKVGLSEVLNTIGFSLVGWTEPVHPTRKAVNWGNRWISALEADERFYRIQGATGSGKSHLTRLFILEALQELKHNPHAKLVVYGPKREFYAWLQSLHLKIIIWYLLASDRRGVAIDFGRDFSTEQDAKTLAHAFWPHDPNEKTRFWGDCMRTIFAAVYLVILDTLGYCDLRLVLAVLEDVEDTRDILGFDVYYRSAQILVQQNGGAVNETMQNIQLSIHSRVSEMKTMASHLHHAARDKDRFSLRDFLHRKRAEILVVSRDGDYGLTQDPMNGMLFMRLVQLLDKEQYDPRRKIFVVIDEFPKLAGDNPCPDIVDMFLRLRDRGVVVLITYQAAESIERIYGRLAAQEILKQCQNVISDLEPATARKGIRGKARAAVPHWWQSRDFDFHYWPKLVKHHIPKTDKAIPEYVERDTSEQRMDGLTKDERRDLGLPIIRFKQKGDKK